VSFEAGGSRGVGTGEIRGVSAGLGVRWAVGTGQAVLGGGEGGGWWAVEEERRCAVWGVEEELSGAVRCGGEEDGWWVVEEERCSAVWVVEEERYRAVLCCAVGAVLSVRCCRLLRSDFQ